MAGAAEFARSRALVATTAPSAWQRWSPGSLARAFTAAALALHGVVFGFNAPLGQWFGGGVLLMAAGAAWAVWARRSLRHAHTPLTATVQPVMLVDDGPYRYGRHPMYLGIVVTMLGIGLAAGVPFMAIAALNLAVVVSSVHIPFEEAQLQRAFGGWYSDYAASVRRWF